MLQLEWQTLAVSAATTLSVISQSSTVGGAAIGQTRVSVDSTVALDVFTVSLDNGAARNALLAALDSVAAQAGQALSVRAFYAAGDGDVASWLAQHAAWWAAVPVDSVVGCVVAVMVWRSSVLRASLADDDNDDEYE